MTSGGLVSNIARPAGPLTLDIVSGVDSILIRIYPCPQHLKFRILLFRGPSGFGLDTNPGTWRKKVLSYASSGFPMGAFGNRASLDEVILAESITADRHIRLSAGCTHLTFDCFVLIWNAH